MNRLDWRSLLNQPNSPSVVIRKSPFSQSHDDTCSGDAAVSHEQRQQQQLEQLEKQKSAEIVVPILFAKASMRKIPESKLDSCKEPLTQLQRLQFLQQQTSNMLAAAAKLAESGVQLQRTQQQEQQQHRYDQSAQQRIMRPVPPPQHLTPDSSYFWSGGYMSAVSKSGTAAAESGQSGSNGHRAHSQQQGSTAVAESWQRKAVSMQTSETTAVQRSTNASEVLSTACSPAKSWGPALSRLKQLQQQTVEMLKAN